MEKLAFYFSHSWNDLKVGGRRTLFALLCVAAGVAAVVSLQSLGAMIEGSLTGNLQELNRGDIRVLSPGPGPDRPGRADVPYDNRYLASSSVSFALFTDNAIQAIDQAVQRYDPEAEITYRHISPANPIAGTLVETDDGAKPILGLWIESDKYPLYGDFRTIDGKPIRDLMQEPTDIIISDNAAEDNGFEVGDEIILNGSDTPFIIRGIVSREQESFTENFILVTLTGFYYMDVSALPLFEDMEGDGTERYAIEIYVKLSQTDPNHVTEIAENLRNQFPFIGVTTTSDLRERNSQITSAVNDLVLLMGFVSLLIGGIGVINTMLVIVARRTTEIAVLKTIGLKAYQVTILFLVESVILGVVGSVIGCVLGVGLAAIMQQSDSLFGTQLIWVFSPAAVIRGLILGVLVTAVFGFLPTLIAGQVRPGNVLRPSSTQLPSVGVIQTLVTLIVIFVVLGLVAWSILGDRISPSAEDPSGGLSVALAFALAFGVGGAAIAPGLGFVRRSADALTPSGKWSRWALLGLGLIVQSILQSVLFFATNIVIVAIIYGKLTTLNVAVSAIIGIMLGLVVAANAYLRQRYIFIVLGAVLFGFVVMSGLGLLVGMVIGMILKALTESGTGWQTVIDMFMGITLIEITFVGAMMLVAVLWFLVTLTARMPTMGVPDFKISLRALVTNRNRISTTLLALVIGVLTLSLVTMFASSLKRFFEVNLEENIGGNVLIVTLNSGATWRQTLDNLETTIVGTDSVRDYSLLTNYQVDFIALEKADGRRIKRSQLIDRMAEEIGENENLGDFLDFSLGSVDGRFVDRNLPEKEFVGSNRQLGPQDAGQQVVVVAGTSAVRAAGIEAGDVLIWRFPNDGSGEPRQMRFEVVGVSDESIGDLSSDAGSFVYAPIDAFGDIPPNFIGGVVDLDEDEIGAFRRRVTDNVGNVVVLETRLLNQIVSRVIDQFTALPFVVAILNLITGGAVIANSVALSTMERRREIGVMKSLGVQRERVLGMLLLENGLMGFLAGLIGVGASLLLLIQLWAYLFDGELKGALPVGTALVLMVVCIAVSVVAAILTAWGASGEKPLTVLRNE